jgi:hypothetical protein
VRKREITCPSCHKVLSMEWQVRDASLTCPSCLAPIANPNEAVQATASAPAPLRVAPATCPECGKTTDSQWTWCPYCNGRLQPVRRRDGVQKNTGVDAQVKRDSRGSNTAFVVMLVIVLGLGLFPVLIAGLGTGPAGPGGGSADRLGPMLGILVAVAVPVLLVVGLIALIRKSKSTGATVLYAIGLGVVLTVAAPFVLFALLFAVCACGGPMGVK